MKGFTQAFAGAMLLASSAAAATLDRIMIKGSHFFYATNGSQFYIRGVAYQQNVNSNGTISGTGDSYSDPLANAAACARDVPYLQALRTNVIRVYAVDPTQNHDACMNLLANAGIYVISDLSEPSLSIESNTPAWNGDLYTRYTSVVDMFSKYTNVIGFFAGNEVSNLPNNTMASAFVKAAVRDTKAYIQTKNYPNLYVGYATYDGPIQLELAQYFDCGPAASAIDFWGWNVYSWCSPSSFEASGYQAETKFFQNYNVPVFFAEYGCNVVEPRNFAEVAVLYGSQMTDVWSGGIVYMYFQEVNNYGLVDVINSASVSPRPDYTFLSSAIAVVNPTSLTASAYTPTATADSCPTLGANWNALASPLPPTPNANLCSCMTNTLTCVVKAGLDVNYYEGNFNYICEQDPSACAGIQANATTGTYGAYSVCNSTQQLSFVMNQYYFAQPAGAARASACNFAGNATSRAAASASGTCVALISQAGANGNGSVAQATVVATTVATATRSATKAAAAGLNVPMMETGLFQLGVYIFGAALTGFGMIFL